MTRWIHELPGWPALTWRNEALAAPLADARLAQGRLLGQMSALGFPVRAQLTLSATTADVVKSSEIEGEILDARQVRSSVARRLGLEVAGLVAPDPRVEGIVEVLLDATREYARPLTAERLYGWHAALFPTGFSAMSRIPVGRWRDDATGPMQVVSGPYGRERVHFEAPAAARVPAEMEAFLSWFEAANDLDPLLKGGLAHLWFVTIHPLADGNGRIGRAIADLQMARSDGSEDRYYSLSSQIRAERAAYYRALQLAQRSPTVDVTSWLLWFVGCLHRAIGAAETATGRAIARQRLWSDPTTESLNERQRRVLARLLEGFEGSLTTSKWAKLAKCSQDTALRDIHGLVDAGILVRDEAGGRSTSYSLR